MYKITIQQKELLKGLHYNETSEFNPIQDINNDWFISEQEVKTKKFDWFADLKPSEFVAKPEEESNLIIK